MVLFDSSLQTEITNKIETGVFLSVCKGLFIEIPDLPMLLCQQYSNYLGLPLFEFHTFELPHAPNGALRVLVQNILRGELTLVRLIFPGHATIMVFYRKNTDDENSLFSMFINSGRKYPDIRGHRKNDYPVRVVKR